ncbi:MULTISPECIES: AraC family transcriptional regulator [unclassified Sphingomonas]|uniref:AraC family transcriptional regulator n=1 Tax=unclassified Sphingomonas TaxID=196159 RepID=UPI0006F29E6B|nr:MULTISPECIES: AraC family transcriptional regulator [unclassified Sphingomonas]KQM60037.1 AraC family transcriptional regulator [Sphingomonas sp. Leaf16]KQN11435.1 AraC family transcriptional regulator [Sphingomonas sp. Leaf29]KQN18756.1 AraC family transcriptional regulator [Sphingomonas sp. Leaf32]
MTANASPYHDRMQRALDHIDRHLDDELDLASISAVAAFSKYHFHRQFVATFGLTVHRYVQLARLQRASHRLAFHGERVTDVALDAGYDAPDAFARAFRRHFGQSPSSFRSVPDWAPWRAALLPLDHARNRSMPSYDVTIRDFPDTRIAFLSHVGDMTGIGDTIRRFIAWRRANRLPPSEGATFNIFHSDPQAMAAGPVRIDLCVATDRDVSVEEGVTIGLIPGGRCAVVRITGRADDLEAPALHLYRDWLPESGEELRDFPLFCQRVRFFPDVAEHDAVTDLFLPLR